MYKIIIWQNRNIAEEAYKNGYAKGYKDGVASREELEKKVKALEKSNRNWRRKVQRLRNENNEKK